MSQIYKFRVGRERVFYGSFLTLFLPRPALFYCVTRAWLCWSSLESRTRADLPAHGLFQIVVSPISHDRADQAANETADQAAAHIAPAVAVTRRVVVVMVVRVVPRRRRGCVMRDLVPRLVVPHRSGVVFASRRLGHLRCLGVPFRCLRFHGSRGLSALWRIALGSCNRCSAESSANCQCQHHLLDCLVHCRVPFFALRKPILALTPR